jgi:NAD(P)-dependent dehydrogenase (short-subunit alcohol dehydrogenase family)
VNYWKVEKMKNKPVSLARLFNLSGKTVLITGATGQLGFEMCKTYNALGCNVIGIDNNINHDQKVKSRNCEYFLVDIGKGKDELRKGFEDIFKKYPTIDILINNAGVSCFEPFEVRPEESFDWVMDVNLKGTFFCIQEYANHSIANTHKGTIVNIGSVYGIISPDHRIYAEGDRKNSEVYGATKAGVIQMTKYFAVHLAKHNIRVNCVSPGGIYNPSTPQKNEFIEEYSKRNPMGRMANTEEIIGAIIYFSTDSSTYTTGQNLVIDGGMSCW